MVFPVDPSDLILDERRLFLVQDPELCSRILPLFSFDPTHADLRPQGHGTAFRIDPWSRCATAFHVLEDMFELDAAGTGLAIKPTIRLVALEVSSLGYGLLPVPDGAWRPLAGAHSIINVEEPPLGERRLRNIVELMVVRIRPNTPPGSRIPYLPVDFRRWQPRIGESIMALGYADLDVDENDRGPDRAISQYLYGSLGQITDIEPADGSRGRPWPILRIDGNWPGGMSGGPVFNEAGHVIGIVSTGFAGDGGATATFFSAWEMPERVFGSIDPSNPGFFRCWAAFDAADEVLICGQDRNEIERLGREKGAARIAVVSIDPATGDYVHQG